jgi:hypothetical protein
VLEALITHKYKNFNIYFITRDLNYWVQLEKTLTLGVRSCCCGELPSWIRSYINNAEDGIASVNGNIKIDWLWHLRVASIFNVKQ